ncbi:HAD family hydrolase [Methanocella arvoryzae]|uniref:Beta-phosphoglucomutase n=1 Tax=Methanocella arvoryzae (strain DSM 22066 / NBRC 105507 / MRE50) TaxID=351160 RepID=Q0W6Q6_METAR|nr:HAD family phosphatase [Methanocella arvoryzae]CAJ35937.1 beta-phosphoglucomutase [Methanocella arvoryzae MRE50]
MAEHCIINISRFRAVLFDMDGVITDTMPVHLKAWQEAFKPYGVTVEKMDVYLREGMTSKTMAESIAGEKQKSLTAEELEKIVAAKSAFFDREVSAHVKVFEGVPGILRMIRNNGIKTALVTGSRAQSVKAVLHKAGIEDLFDLIITGDDTKTGKPSPDPYLTAMRRLGISRINCVVVENAPLGIQSAKAAGAEYVIAVTTSLDASYLKDADDVMASVAELETCLARRFAALPGPASP